MHGIEFLDNPSAYNPDIAFIAHFSRIPSKEDLFKQFSDKLQLPSYFGSNWDALSDCLRDFHWIEQQKIVIVHDDYPELNERDLKTYLQILFDAIQEWKEDKLHSLEVVFPKYARDLILRYSL